MIPASDRQRVLAKLISACNDQEDALNHSVPGARYDPLVIPQVLRNAFLFCAMNLFELFASWRRVHNTHCSNPRLWFKQLRAFLEIWLPGGLTVIMTVFEGSSSLGSRFPMATG